MNNNCSNRKGEADKIGKNMKKLKKINKGLVLTIIVLIILIIYLAGVEKQRKADRADIKVACENFLNITDKYSVLPEEIRTLTGEELENKKQEYIKELHNELEKVMIENEDAIKIQQDFAIANLNSGYQDGETRIKFEHTNIEMSSFTFDGDQVTVSINGQIETASNYMNDNNEIKEKQNSMPIAMEEITLQKVNGKWKVVYANLIYYSENSYQNSINMY